MGKFSGSWALMKASWEVLKKDKEILVFPILSGIMLVLVILSFIFPMILADSLFSLEQMTSEVEKVFNSVVIFLFYFIIYFVMIFFNSAIIACAIIRMNGGDPTVGDGLKAALSRLTYIAGWSLIAASVGLILRLIEERFEFAGRIVAAVIGVAWSMTSFLVIPVLVIEKMDPFSAFKKSASLLKKTWGEQLIGNFSFGLIFFVLTVPGILLIIFAAMIGGGFLTTFMIIFAVFYFLVMLTIQSTLQGIFQAALYLYASSGTVPEQFKTELLKGAIRSG